MYIHFIFTHSTGLVDLSQLLYVYILQIDPLPIHLFAIFEIERFEETLWRIWSFLVKLVLIFDIFQFWFQDQLEKFEILIGLAEGRRVGDVPTRFGRSRVSAIYRNFDIALSLNSLRAIGPSLFFAFSTDCWKCKFSTLFIIEHRPPFTSQFFRCFVTHLPINNSLISKTWKYFDANISRK